MGDDKTDLETARRGSWILAWVFSPVALVGCSEAPPVSTAATVAPAVETGPVVSSKDAADDPSIWVHPTDPSQSTVIVTDKGFGLIVHDLQGDRIQLLGDGELNNVDVRYGMPFAGGTVDIVASGNRTKGEISVYSVDVATRQLQSIGHVPIDIYPVGFCLYHRGDNDFYAFITTHEGLVEQWRLADNGRGAVEGQRVRSFQVGRAQPERFEEKGFSATEGCVVDDEFGWLYVSEEEAALWKFPADPGAGESPGKIIHRVSENSVLTPDIEGLAVYYGPDGSGYLIVANQMRSEFVVFRREGDNEHVGSFRVEEGNGIDRVSHTDGIDVTSVALGPTFPGGMFIAQDNDNLPQRQNFKLVRWDAIAAAFSPPLQVDSSWSPRDPG